MYSGAMTYRIGEMGKITSIVFTLPLLEISLTKIMTSLVSRVSSGMVISCISEKQIS